MRITQISVNITETCNLGDYSNTKPSIELSAQLDATDDPAMVLESLINMAKEHVHAAVDLERLAVGREPKYYTGPVFACLNSSRYNFYAIVPAGHPKIPHAYAEARRLPLQWAMQNIERNDDFGDRLFFNCSDGNLTDLLAHIEWKEQEIQKAELERKRRQEEERRQWQAKQREDEEEEDEEEEEDFDDEEDAS